MKSVLISIRPKWCGMIADGRKTIEVRKTRPKIETPFRCCIYCTNSGRPLVYGDVPCAGGWAEKYTQTYGYSRTEAERIWGVMNGKVIGEFVCDKINSYVMCGTNRRDMRYYRADENRHVWPIDYGEMCLSAAEFADYGSGKQLYGWHISDLKIYDDPGLLDEWGFIYPPRSWCYVEEI